MEALIPNNIEAERRVIGALLLDTSLILDVSSQLKPEFFFSPPHSWVFEAICKLHVDGSPVTPETVSNVLKGRKELDRTRLEIVGSISDYLVGVSTGEVKFWLEQVVSKHQERLLLEFAEECRQKALSNPEDIKKVRDSLEAKLISFSGTITSNNSISIDNSMGELENRIQRYIDNPHGIIGLPTGYNRLDRALDGLQPGNVTILYAPSSRFKSLFSQNIGWNLSRENIPGLWFTTEMPRVQVLERLLQLESGLNLKWLRRDNNIISHRDRIDRSSEIIRHYPITFCDTSSLDVSEVRSIVNRQIRWKSIEYIIVDLVDHIHSSRFKDEMVNNQRAVMAAMKQLAKDFNIHVLLVSHVGKGDEQKRKQADLDVEEMIGSAAKYQDVDAAISIAPVKYDLMNNLIAQDRNDIIWNVANSGKLDTLVSITKNRHGELDRFELTLDFHKGGRFIENGWLQLEPKQEKLDIEEKV